MEEDLLKKNLDRLAEAMQKDPHFVVYSLEKAKTVQEGEYYLSYIEINLSIRDFDSLVRFMFFYAPSSIEVISPDKIAFAAHDFQDGLVTMSDLINKYSSYISKIINKEELDKFHEKLYT